LITRPRSLLMPCSPAQLQANRRNAARSTGPRTPLGKSVSRRNGLKHGLTGQGIVLPEEDAEEVDRRFAALEEELRPTAGIELELVKRVALMTVRLDRSAEHEARSLAHGMRVAVAEFDDARLAEVESLYSWIAREPETNARRLRGSPEGLARLIEAMEALRSDLAHPHGYRWDFGHADHLHHLMGRRQMDLPASRALSEAVVGRFQHLDAEDGAGLEGDDRRRWAIGELTDLIDAEVAALKARLEGFDRAALEHDRAEAPARALFDASKEAVLARKYEAASERALYRALRELREIRAEPPRVEVEAEKVEDEEGVAPEPSEELGSCSPDSSDAQDAGSAADAASPIEPSTLPRRRPDPEKLARKGRRRAKVG
jgi:hypothetical protein